MKKLILFLSIVLSASALPQKDNKLELGADRLFTDYLHLIDGKTVGLVTNHTALLSSGDHLADAISKTEGVKLGALFGPEHGVRGNAPAGDHIADAVDPETGVKVYSLYGANRKPTSDMLKGIDLLIFDIQDVGARFYTYISTLFYIVQTSAEHNIPLLVLDRPNPINGVSVDGPIRKEDQVSFVGIAPIPIMHGMTVGELAEYFAGEGLIGSGLKPDLSVIKMKNWKRDTYFDDYGLSWNPPSPNIPSLEAAIIYPGTCLIEGVNVSEGRGTYEPFTTIGAPYIDGADLIAELEEFGYEGLSLEPVKFTPKNIPGMATSPKYLNEECGGIKISIVERGKVNRVKFGIQLICAVHSLYPDSLKFRDSGFDRLAGDKKVREMITGGSSPEEITAYWQDELDAFLSIRNKYLLY